MNNKRNPGHIITSRPLLALPCYVVSAHAAQHTIDRINVGSAIEKEGPQGVESARRSGRGSLSSRFFSAHVTRLHTPAYGCTWAGPVVASEK